MLSNCDAGEDSWVLWTTIRSNQSILKEINPEYSLEGVMLKLKLQCFGHLMQRDDSLEKTLMLGKIEGRRRGQQRMRWLDGIIHSMAMSLSKLWEMVKNRKAWRVAVHCITKSQTRLSNWTTIYIYIYKISQSWYFYLWEGQVWSELTGLIRCRRTLCDSFAFLLNLVVCSVFNG